MYCFHLLNLSTSNIKAKSLQFHVKRNRTNFPEQESPYDCSRLAKSDLLNSIRLQNAKCIHMQAPLTTGSRVLRLKKKNGFAGLC